MYHQERKMRIVNMVKSESEFVMSTIFMMSVIELLTLGSDSINSIFGHVNSNFYYVNV